jgi:hypothetical protein
LPSFYDNNVSLGIEKVWLYISQAFALPRSDILVGGGLWRTVQKDLRG